MAKPQINSYEDLMDEKLRLKQNFQLAKAEIQKSFDGIKDELNPFAALKDTAKSSLSTSTTNPIVKFGIRRASEFLIGKVLLKKAGWLPRMTVSFLVRATASRLVGNKPDRQIASILRTTAEKIRSTKIPELSKRKKTD